MARPKVRSVEGSKDVHYRVKTGLPAIHFRQVHRSRLHDIVGDAVDYRVTLITAPAGYGKTTALVQGIEAAQLPAAWLTLDPSDNDLNRFWQYLVLAVAELIPESVQSLAADLATSQPPTQRIIDELLDQLQQRTQPILIVLDNFHCLKNPAVLDTFGFFLQYLPESVHVILSGRGASISLSPRLDVAHEIRHISRADLRFDEKEIHAYCDLTELHLDQAALETLVCCSEGWPAGVAGLLEPLISGGQAFLLKPDCTNLNDELADYIEDEVLTDLSEEEMEFLTKTSILSKLTPAFCQALTGREDSLAILQSLCRKNLLLDPIPGQPDQFRLHRLLRIWLNRRLNVQFGETARFLYLSAADYQESRGELAKAFRYLKFSGDLNKLTAFVRQHGADLLRTGESRSLANWLQDLPKDAVSADAILSCLKAWTSLIQRQQPALEKALADIRSILQGSAMETQSVLEPIRAELKILEGMKEYVQGDHGLAADHLQEAAEMTRDTLLFSGGIDLTDGQVNLTGGLFGNYGNISLLDEDFFASLHRMEGAWGARGVRQILKGELLYEQDQLEEACPHLMQGLREAMAYQCNGSLTAAVIALSRLRRAAGDLEGAVEIVRIGRDWLTKQGILHQEPPLDAWLCLLKCEDGEGTSAQEWIWRSHLLSSPGAEGSRLFEYLVLARLQLTLGQLENCENLLSELNVLMEEEPSTWYEIKILVLRAACRHLQGADPEARADLKRALALGQREGYLRIFLDEGKLIEELLHAMVLDRSEESDRELRQFSGRIYQRIRGGEFPEVELCDFRPPGYSLAEDSLTLRELDVLCRMTQGRSNKEIAQELHVSLATVKFHCTNIYRKLNVTRRQSAILSAIEKKLV